MLNRLLSAGIAIFLFTGCSNSADHEIISLSRIPGSKSRPKNCEMAWNQFNEKLENHSRACANQVFKKVIDSPYRNNYLVNVTEESFSPTDDKYFTESSTYMFLEKDEKTRYSKPTCVIFYLRGNDTISIASRDHNVLALHGFKEKRDLTIVKDDCVDAIAAFKSKDFGFDQQFVVRSIAGPDNTSVGIWYADDLNGLQYTKEEMIERISRIDKNEIFPPQVLCKSSEEALGESVSKSLKNSGVAMIVLEKKVEDNLDAK